MRIHRANTIGLGLLILFGSAGKASAWDDLGHTVVCAIAFQELNDKARQEVTRLIGMDDQFKTFAESCTWPDNPKQRSNEHYINVVRDFAKFSTPTCPMASKCLFTAIDEDVRVLSTTTDDKAKLAALKFLGHWIGDLHQPLHVSFEDDRGGGKVLTSGSCGLNLHAVWDGCIVAMKLGSDWRTVARDLSKDITPRDRAAWTGTKVEAWVNESFDTARQAQVGYCIREGNGCIYAPGHPTYNAGETEKVVVVDNAYLERNAPIVAGRLRQAGVRLAHLLNRSLGK
jgi:S1/P1 Nuclease